MKSIGFSGCGRPHSSVVEQPFCWMGWPMILAILILLPHAASGQSDAAGSVDPGYRPDRILVRMKTGARKSALSLVQGQRLLRYYPETELQVIELPKGVAVLDALARYRASGSVLFAEPDYIIQGAELPNDPAFVNGAQWGMHNVGQNGGLTDADIDAPEAWAITRNASNIVVAVIDTGVRFTHEELAQNMWRNPREIPDNRRDDDGNGIIDDVHGLNAIDNSGVPNDEHGHGTHVAGTIGARGNNGKGGAGIAWSVQIMACKFLDGSNRGSIADAIECINYARVNGAHIINASWTAAKHSSALQFTINTTKNRGILFVTAAGNESANIDLNAVYPASYDLDNIVVVTGLSRNDALDLSYANFGALSVDIGAPGTSIFSCWNSSDSSYRHLSGTSMAVPFVSGTLALMKNRYPTETHRQLIARLLASTDPVPSLSGKTVSGGRVNVRKALGITEPDVVVPTAPAPIAPPASPQSPSSIYLTVKPNAITEVHVSGEAGRSYVLQVSTNCIDWSVVSTNRAGADGKVLFTPRTSFNSRAQFFRTMSLP